MQMPSMCVVAEMSEFNSSIVAEIHNKLDYLIHRINRCTISEDKYDNLYFAVVNLRDELEELL